VEELHSQLRHTALVVRNGKPATVDVTTLVPGDVVELGVGDVVPADLRLLRADGLECDESVLTGEAAAAEKQVETIESPESPVALPSCAFMGTVVKDGGGRGGRRRNRRSNRFRGHRDGSWASGSPRRRSRSACGSTRRSSCA